VYHQLFKTKPEKITVEPAEQVPDSDIVDEACWPSDVQPPIVLMQSPKAMVLSPKAAAWPHVVNPIDDSDDDLT